jgi:hypothetical protein
MPAITYSRQGGFMPPRDDEVLHVGTDGTCNLWRSVGWDTRPPTPVGRFAGRLAADENASLQAEAIAAAQAGAFLQPILPDSPVETVTIDQLSSVLGVHGDPPGVWKPLVRHLRVLLVNLTRFPTAAIALKVAPDGKSARLVHQGSDAVRLDLSSLAVQATLREGGSQTEEWHAPARGPTDVTAVVGWTYEIPFDHGFDIQAGRSVTARVYFVILDGERQVPASLDSTQ